MQDMKNRTILKVLSRMSGHFKSEQEESLDEYEWAFGEFAPARMEEDVKEIIDNIADVTEIAAGTRELIDEAIGHAHIWGGLGSIDEDELLRRLELHASELAKRVHNNETTIAHIIEQRRHEIAEHLMEVNPQAARRLREHQKMLEERLKEETKKKK